MEIQTLVNEYKIFHVIIHGYSYGNMSLNEFNEILKNEKWEIVTVTGCSKDSIAVATKRKIFVSPSELK